MMKRTMLGGEETVGGGMGRVRPTQRPTTTASAPAQPIA
jgi:hypothetical protein